MPPKSLLHKCRLLLLCLILAPASVWAQWEAKPLKIVVLPFEGKGTGGLTAAEAIELELEMVTHVRLASSRGPRVELSKRAPDQNYTADDLAAVMQQFELDVLIRGERVEGEMDGSQLKILVYSIDGLPRWQKAMPLPSNPVQAASRTGKRLVRVLEDWETLPPLEEELVISMVDEPEDEPPRPLSKPTPAPEDRTWVAPMPKVERQPKRRASYGERAERFTRRRASLLDDGPMGADVVSGQKDAKSGEEDSLWGVGLGAGMWRYQLSGGSEAYVAEVGADVYPTLDLRLRTWMSRWLGLDVVASASKLDFEINSAPTLTISPESFSAYHMSAAPALMFRLWRGEGKHPSFFALRAGYFFSMATTEAQKVNGQNTTLVPGWLLHAPTLGMGFRLGAEGPGFSWVTHVDVLPWGVYQETPDNPGAQVQPFGWALETFVRHQLPKAFYWEVGIASQGLLAQFDGVGDRRSSDGGPWRDGRSSNWSLRPMLRLGTTF